MSDILANRDIPIRLNNTYMEKTQPEKRGSIFRKVSIDGNAGPTMEMSSAPMSTPTNKRTTTAFWLFRSICMSTEISEEKWSMNFVQIKHKQSSRLKVCAFISRADVSSCMPSSRPLPIPCVSGADTFPGSSPARTTHRIRGHRVAGITRDIIRRVIPGSMKFPVPGEMAGK